jgi:hypothetical protein
MAIPNNNSQQFGNPQPINSQPTPQPNNFVPMDTPANAQPNSFVPMDAPINGQSNSFTPMDNPVQSQSIANNMDPMTNVMPEIQSENTLSFDQNPVVSDPQTSTSINDQQTGMDTNAMVQNNLMDIPNLEPIMQDQNINNNIEVTNPVAEPINSMSSDPVMPTTNMEPQTADLNLNNIQNIQPQVTDSFVQAPVDSTINPVVNQQLPNDNFNNPLIAEHKSLAQLAEEAEAKRMAEMQLQQPVTDPTPIANIEQQPASVFENSEISQPMQDIPGMVDNATQNFGNQFEQTNNAIPDTIDMMQQPSNINQMDNANSFDLPVQNADLSGYAIGQDNNQIPQTDQSVNTIDQFSPMDSMQQTTQPMEQVVMDNNINNQFDSANSFQTMESPQQFVQPLEQVVDQGFTPQVNNVAMDMMNNEALPPINNDISYGMEKTNSRSIPKLIIGLLLIVILILVGIFFILLGLHTANWIDFNVPLFDTILSNF